MASIKKTTKTRSKKQHTPDFYPVQRTIPLSGTVAANGGIIAGTMTADAGRLLSNVNRRLYRYGNLYQIKLDLDNIGQAVGTAFDVEVFALRNNWDVQRAYALAKKVYDEAYADELKHTGGANLARWRDFRVNDGVTGAVDLYPVKRDSAALTVDIDDDGEFTLSAVDDAGTEKSFTWGNASATSIDITNEWTEAGRTAADPNTISTSAPYAGVNSDAMSDIEMGNLGNDGNNPPYNAQAATDQLYRVATMRYEPGPTGLQRLSTGYFDAPCGLFVIKVTSGVNLGAGTMSITCKSGDYKGVHAKGMCQ